MQPLHVVIVVASLLFRAAPAVGGRLAGTARLKLEVHDQAGVPREVLSVVRENIRTAFATMAVEVRWPAGTPEPPQRADACPQPFTILVLIRPHRAQWQPRETGVMGEALASDEGHGVVVLFFDAVSQVVRQYGGSLGEVLTVAMLHELGHALLRHPAHSTSGIMQPRWEGDDLRHAGAGSWFFADDQAAEIRDRLVRRCPPQ